MNSDVEGIIAELGPPEVIEQAVDLVRANHGVGHGEALDLLVRGSAKSHRKVREVAAQIVRSATRRQLKSGSRTVRLRRARRGTRLVVTVNLPK